MKTVAKILLFIVGLLAFLPAYANISISPLKHEISVEEGQASVKTIKLKNTGDKAMTLYTSKEDFVAGDDSWTPRFIKPEDMPNPDLSLSNWITLENENISLAPNETKEIKFVVNVPQKAEPGWHYWAIFFAPEIPQGAQVAVVQRIWVLVLIDVPWEVKVGWEFKETKIGQPWEEGFEVKDTFDSVPVVFAVDFENTWNTHLKPKGKIELVDEDWNLLEKIWKEAIVSPQGAFIWERVVDYIPVNDWNGNVLPSSNRVFKSEWLWFGYTELDETTGQKLAKFKWIEDYYAEEFSKRGVLKFYEQERQREITKEITARYELYYEGKDKEKKVVNKNEKFKVTYTEQYVWYNYLVIGGLWTFVLLILIYLIFIRPKHSNKKEEEMRRKIMEEMQKQNNKDN